MRHDGPQRNADDNDAMQGDSRNAANPPDEKECSKCTPQAHETEGPQLLPMQNDDVLRDCFDGKVYEAQRADGIQALGSTALMLALALYSDGTVVTSSGGQTWSSICMASACCPLRLFVSR